MKWTITDNLAMEVTEIETVVADEDAHEPMFEFKSERGHRFGVQLLHDGFVIGHWDSEGEWQWGLAPIEDDEVEDESDDTDETPCIVCLEPGCKGGCL